MSVRVIGARSATMAALFLALSCGGVSPALQAPAAPINSATAPTLPRAPNLSAVPDPPALVISGSFTKPSASLSTLRIWSKLPMPQPQELTELLMGEAVGPLIDLDQSIEFAVAIAGSGLHVRDRMAVSAALKDVEQAKAILSERFKLVAGDNDVLLIQGLGRSSHRDEDQGEDDRTDGDQRACELAPAYGAAPVRLVCGSTTKALSDLGPWLTRTATRTTTTSDLHLELRMGPLRSTIARQKRLIGSVLAGVFGPGLEPGGVRELVASVGGDVIDFALDLDSASLDVQLTEPVATATATLLFSSTTSALARIATAHPDRSAPAPAAFWQLPGDTDFAFFHRGIDAAELARWREIALRAVAEGLSEQGLKEADEKPVLEALGKMTSSAPILYASGVDADAVAKALAAEKALQDVSDAPALAKAKHASAEALLGWRVMEFEEPSSAIAAAAKKLAVAWATPSIGAAYRVKSKGASPPVLRVAPLPKGVKLPAGTQHYVLELYPFDSAASAVGATGPGKPKSPAVVSPPRAIHGFLIVDGSRTWVGLGGSDVLVASKLAATIAPAPGSGLSARAELAPFSAASVGAGGFATARGLPQAFEPFAALLDSSTPDASAALFVPAQLPHQGAAPITFSFTANTHGSLPEVTASLQVPRAAIEDVIAVIVRHGL